MPLVRRVPVAASHGHGPRHGVTMHPAAVAGSMPSTHGHVRGRHTPDSAGPCHVPCLVLAVPVPCVLLLALLLLLTKLVVLRRTPMATWCEYDGVRHVQ